MTGRRLLGLAVTGLVLAAVALWGASRATWLTAVWDTPLRGRVVAVADGASTEAILVPWALLALAAVAGVLATSGRGRRGVGAIVALAGAWAVVRVLAALGPPAPDALPGSVRRPGRVVEVSAGIVGPLTAAAGALLLLAVGVLVVVVAPRLPRLGARYDAPGAPGAGSARRRPRDADDELWTALDEGRDPTGDATGDPTGEPPAPGVGRRSES